MKNKFYSGILLLSVTCSPTILSPLRPEYPLRIGNYSAFVNDKPGNYDEIRIGNRTYCYFSKRLDDGDYLFIDDYGCDEHSDRVLVLSGDKVIFAQDTKSLDKELVQNLNYILLNYRK